MKTADKVLAKKILHSKSGMKQSRDEDKLFLSFVLYSELVTANMLNDSLS